MSDHHYVPQTVVDVRDTVKEDVHGRDDDPINLTMRLEECSIGDTPPSSVTPQPHALSETTRALLDAGIRKAKLLEKLAELDEKEAAWTREKQQVFDEIRSITNEELAVMAPLPPADEHVTTRKAKNGSSKTLKDERKVGKQEIGIGMEELQEYIEGLKLTRKNRTGKFDCPKCPVKPTKIDKLVRHMYSHLGDDTYYPYKCSVDDCSRKAIRLEHMKEHVKSHKLAWNDDLKDRCVVQENLDRYTSLWRLSA